MQVIQWPQFFTSAVNSPWPERHPVRSISPGEYDSLYKFEFYFIDIAPAPIVTGFQRFHDGVLSRVKVFGRVLILRRVATANVAARETQAEMNPGVPAFQALLAAASVRLYILNLIGMGTALHSVSSCSMMVSGYCNIRPRGGSGDGFFALAAIRASAAFQVSPKSLRLIFAEAEARTRVFQKNPSLPAWGLPCLARVT